MFRGTPWVWPVTLAFAVVNLVQTGTWQILGPQLTEQLSGSAALWGLVLSARGVGMLVMSGVTYRLTLRHLARAGQLASVLGALPLLAVGQRFAAPLLLAAAFTAGLGSALTMTAWDTSLQEHIPERVLSRVAAYDDLLSYIAIPVGQLAVGPLAQRFGGFDVATTASLCYAVVALLPLASPALRRLPHGSPPGWARTALRSRSGPGGCRAPAQPGAACGGARVGCPSGEVIGRQVGWRLRKPRRCGRARGR
ncbi:hypothetical protein ACFQZC_04515 [Streptacidiphilus monticola]